MNQLRKKKSLFAVFHNKTTIIFNTTITSIQTSNSIFFTRHGAVRAVKHARVRMCEWKVQLCFLLLYPPTDFCNLAKINLLLNKNISARIDLYGNFFSLSLS